jgi:hypothetical protein
VARWLRWYGPDSGKGSVEDIVSHQPQVKAELAYQANLIASRARSNLEIRPETRTGEAQIGIHGPAQGRYLDYIVFLDPGGDRPGEDVKAAAINIERRHGILSEAVGRAIRRGMSA